MRTFGLTILTLCVLTGPGAPPAEAAVETSILKQYGSVESGPYPAGTIPSAVFRDASRSKDVEMDIDYPMRGGPHPVIVFSHGFGTSGVCYLPLTSFWASHGYVVIRPRHADWGVLGEWPSLRARPEHRARPRTREQKREARKAMAEPLWAEQSDDEWRTRVEDVVFVVDSLQQIEERYPELTGRIDRTLVFAGGHAYGAFTALLLGGMTPIVQGTRLHMADARVKAIVALSPQGPAERFGLTAESWRGLTVPVLFLTGSHDVGFFETESWRWRRQAFELSPPGDKYFMSIPGAQNATFTGRYGAIRVYRETESELLRRETLPGAGVRAQRDSPTAAPFDERDLFHGVKRFSLPFLDAYAKDEGPANLYLSVANYARK